MWRSRTGLVALAGAAALLPAVATAQPPAPDPAAPPVLRGAPYLVVEGPGRLTLWVRLERPIERRFDGELRASAVIDGEIASLRPVAGRLGERSDCYAASTAATSVRTGRLVTVTVLLDGPPQTAVTALVAVRGPRRGDARGAPLRC